MSWSRVMTLKVLLVLHAFFYVLLRYYELLLSHIFILDNVPEAIDQFSAFISNRMPVSTRTLPKYSWRFTIQLNHTRAHQYFSFVTKISNYLKTRWFQHINPWDAAEASLTVDDSAFDSIKTSRTSQQMDLQQHHHHINLW